MIVSVAKVVSYEIVFHVGSKNNVFVDEIFNIILEITVVSIVSDEIIFHAVLNIGIVSMASDKTVLHVLSKISVVTNECIVICSLAKQRMSFIFMIGLIKQRSQRNLR